MSAADAGVSAVDANAPRSLLIPEPLGPVSTSERVVSVNGLAPSEYGNLPRFEFVPDDGGRRLTHHLFRFPAKFHPPVVRKLIEDYTDEGDRLLDIFCGSGTLLVEATVGGRHAVGFDVDPLSVFLTRVKCQALDPDELDIASTHLLEELSTLTRTTEEYERRKHEDLEDEEFRAESEGLIIPAIPNLWHWFRRYVAVDLARILIAIDRQPVCSEVRDVFRVVFASSIRTASNADPVPVSGLERTKYMLDRDEEGRIIDPFAVFRRKLKKAVVDVTQFQGERRGAVLTRVQRADVTNTLPLHSDEPVSVACTSPPYHGAVDYYRRHQLEMFWLGLTATQAERLEILAQYLGRPHVPRSHPFVYGGDLTRWKQVAECEREIRKQSPRRADEFRHYCMGMAGATQQLAAALPPGAKSILIVGRSRWNGATLDSSELFRELAGDLFKLTDQFWYPVQNRHMSYGRHNGANIDREFVLVFERTKRK